MLPGAIEAWMLLQFDRAGIAAGTDPDFQYAVGANHVIGKGRERSVMIVGRQRPDRPVRERPELPERRDLRRARAGDRDFVTYVNAQIGTLEPYDRLAWPKQHPVEWARLVSLSAHSDRVAIFETAPPPAPS